MIILRLRHVWRGQRTPGGSQFSAATMWVPGMATSAFAHQALLLAPSFNYSLNLKANLHTNGMAVLVYFPLRTNLV